MRREMPKHSLNVRVPHVLTGAGFDSGAGAGIQADLKACSARGVYCSSVITAVTGQNTVGVQAVNTVMDDFVREQLKSVLSDMHPDVEALVVDPVMESTSGDVLAAPLILDSFREELLPLADIVTPNTKEASALFGGIPLETVADMYSAAKSIHDFGPRLALHKYSACDLPASRDAVDVLFDGKEFYVFRSARIETLNTHGTGCTLASSVAAELARGSSVHSAIKIAKCDIESALDYSQDIIIGGGRQGPFDHLMMLKKNALNLHVHRPFDPSDLLLYAVTDSRMNEKWGHSMSDAVKAATEGVATIIQLREKDAKTGDFTETAKTCLEICRSHGVPLLINDRIDIALACDADGVHVGQSDMPASMARTILGHDKIIGVSCKTPKQAEKAWIDGLDYIGCGGVYPTSTKDSDTVVGLDGLKTVCLKSKLRVVAIGGIGVSKVKPVMGLGVPNLKGVAVVSALFDSQSVLTETQTKYAENLT